jgi:hypothetical protein
VAKSKCGKCGNCRNCRTRERYHSDPEFREKQLKQKREWCRANPQKQKAMVQRWQASTGYEKPYVELPGWSVEYAEAQWQRQEGKCAMCEKELIRKGKGAAHRDHCHATGQARGWLCPTCNHALGWVEGWFDRALVYLSKHTPN